MRWLIMIVFAVIISNSLFAVENQAYLGLFAETQVTKMVGLPDMPDMPNLPDMGGAAGMPGIPGMPDFSMFGKPKRTLTVRLWSPTLAPPEAAASLAPPTGLKQGPKLELSLYRPEPGKVETTPGEFNPDAIEKFTIKRYWGSSPTVKKGQPQVFTWGDLTPEQKAEMKRQAQRAQRSTYFYKPDWTTGYWPTEKQTSSIAADAALPGTYALTTNYTGNISLDVPKTVDFLAPIKFSSPKFEKAPPLEKAIEFKWAAIPAVLGYHAQIMGMEGMNTLILWSAAETPTDMGTSWDYLEMAQVAAFVKSTAMMAGERVNVTVPAGIFTNCDFVQFRMIGFGPGAALAEGQPLPRMQTKTTFSCMLGGKMMEGMGKGGIPAFPMGGKE